MALAVAGVLLFGALGFFDWHAGGFISTGAIQQDDPVGKSDTDQGQEAHQSRRVQADSADNQSDGPAH